MSASPLDYHNPLVMCWQGPPNPQAVIVFPRPDRGSGHPFPLWRPPPRGAPLPLPIRHDALTGQTSLPSPPSPPSLPWSFSLAFSRLHVIPRLIPDIPALLSLQTSGFRKETRQQKTNKDKKDIQCYFFNSRKYRYYPTCRSATLLLSRNR